MSVDSLPTHVRRNDSELKPSSSLYSNLHGVGIPSYKDIAVRAFIVSLVWDRSTHGR